MTDTDFATFEAVIPGDDDEAELSSSASSSYIPKEESETTVGGYPCPLCDRPALPSKQGYNAHLTRIHPGNDHLRITSPASDAKGAGSGRTPSKSMITSTDKSVKAVKATILKEFNPFLISSALQIGMPSMALGIVLIPPTKTVKDFIEFSDGEAEMIARGVVGVQGTPVANILGKTVGPLLPLFFGLTACVVVGMHVWQVTRIPSLLALAIERAGTPNDNPRPSIV